MNKTFEKILERLEEELRKSEERYHRYLDDSNLPCVFDKSDIEETRVDTIKEMLEIVQEVAEEYNGGWIACSERLPNDCDTRFYMCIVENHEEDLPMFCQYEEECGFGFWQDIYDEHTLGFVESIFDI